MSDKTDSDYFAVLLEHRKFLTECKLAASRDRDGTILMVAGGSLAISVAFLERVVDVVGPLSGIVLATGWACEIAAMVLILWSHSASERALETELERVDCMMRTGADNPGWPNRSSARTAKMNTLASVATVAGLVIMLAHAAQSIYEFGLSKGARAMSQSTPTSTSKPTDTTAGYVPPPPPPRNPDPKK